MSLLPPVLDTVADPAGQELTLLDRLPAPVWISGLDGGRTWFNQAWQAHTGRRLIHEQGHGWQKGIHPEDLERCREVLTAAVRERTDYTLEYRLWHASGGYRWLLEQACARHGPQGDWLGHLGLCTDITELKLARSALTECEEEFHSLITNIPGAVFRCAADRDWTVRFVSPLISTLSGYSAEEFTGRALKSLIHAEDRERVLGEVRDQIGLRGSFVVEFRILDKGGSVRWWLASGRAHGGLGASQPDHITGALFDITPLKAAEERLRQTAIVFDNAAEGILITDAEGRIVAVNRAFSELTGYAPEEVLGKSPRILSSGHHDPAFYEAMWEGLLQTGHWRGEIWNRHKNGQVFPLLETISAVRDEAGRVTGYVSLFSDITPIKQTEAKLERLAYHDALTGLPNRLLFDQRLEHAIEQAQRHGERLAVLYFDLDRFKHLNDTLGHQVGDALLRAIAQRLTRRLRKSDTLSRRGGDEFTLLLENLRQPQQAAAVARDILRQLGKPFHLPDGQTVHTGTSIGISLYPDDGSTPRELIDRADAAMYEAKQGGGGQYRFYTPEITLASRERMELEGRLRKAVEAKGLQLAYQPLFHLSDGELVGTEALLRWIDLELGEIPPERFIPMAEEMGLMPTLGAWVLGEACRQTMAWERAGLGPLHVAVNVSARQLKAPDFTRTVRQALEGSGLPPSRLQLELNEAILLGAGDAALEALQELRREGVSITVDDFATGLSSLTRLQRLPVDRLKIDRSFVHDLPDDQEDLRLIQLIVAMARSLRLQVVAEGVETEAQLALFRQERCELAQGHLLCAPLAPEGLPAIVPTARVSH